MLVIDFISVNFVLFIFQTLMHTGEKTASVWLRFSNFSRLLDFE